MVLRLIVLLCWVTLLFTGCQVVVTPAPGLVEAAMDEPFTLHWGETARLPAAELDVTFVSVPADGRCPTNIECAATLPVEVALNVQDTGSSVSSQIVLSAHTDHNGNVIPDAPGVLPADHYGSALITLRSVMPYPETRRPIRPEEYAVTLVVSALVEPSPAVTQVVTPTTVAPGPALGKDVILNYGQAALLEDIGMQLTFDDVVTDSRCPADVTCVWSGIANVKLTAAMPPEPAQQFVVGGTTDLQGNVLGPVVGASGPTAWWYAGYVIALKQVVPYPMHANAPVPFEDYAVTLVVTRASPGDPTPTPALPTATPFPTDLNGLPVLCLSERALTHRIAGEASNMPARLTPPVAETSLTDQAAATALCAGQFGADFHVAENSDLTAIWTEFLPVDAAYWMWDGSSDRPIGAR